jgi:hypothetical protein
LDSNFNSADGYLKRWKDDLWHLVFVARAVRI